MAAPPTSQQHPQRVAPAPAGIPRVGAPAMAPRPAAAPAIAPARPQVMPAHAALVPPAAPAQDDDAISLVEDDTDAGSEAGAVAEIAGPSKIKHGPDLTHRQHDWKRQLNKSPTSPCRVKTFHGKLSDAGLEYVDDAINTWLDAHPEVDVKFVTTNVGMFDGKFKDLALIVNVWY
jgi:hypothetical protein